ncbi:hypothetical protein TNCV_2065371 [Trichonephila clavipes]|nr:hypothetical protein TNCV_2065371 [Trichonephila clavipes]
MSRMSLWDEETGRNIFRMTMSLETFRTKSRVIRFDDKSTRQESKKLDEIAAVRDIWNTEESHRGIKADAPRIVTLLDAFSLTPTWSDTSLPISHRRWGLQAAT